MHVHGPRGPKETEWFCKICNKKFNKKNNRDNHEKRHEGLKPWVCEVSIFIWSLKGLFDIISS